MHGLFRCQVPAGSRDLGRSPMHGLFRCQVPAGSRDLLGAVPPRPALAGPAPGGRPPGPQARRARSAPGSQGRNRLRGEGFLAAGTTCRTELRYWNGVDSLVPKRPDAGRHHAQGLEMGHGEQLDRPFGHQFRRGDRHAGRAGKGPLPDLAPPARRRGHSAPVTLRLSGVNKTEHVYGTEPLTDRIVEKPGQEPRLHPDEEMLRGGMLVHAGLDLGVAGTPSWKPVTRLSRCSATLAGTPQHAAAHALACRSFPTRASPGSVNNLDKVVLPLPRAQGGARASRV